MLTLSFDRKFLLAFVVIVGACGALGIFAILQSARLSRIFTQAAEEVAIHDNVATFRATLLDLDVLAQRYVLGDADAREAFAASYESLLTIAARCDACHQSLGASMRAHHLLDAAAELADGLRANKAIHADTDGVRLLRSFALATTDACNALSVMERRYNREMERYQSRAAELAGDRSRALFGALLFALVLVVGTGVWLTRTLSHPVQRLIEAAEHIGEGDFGYRVPLPREPGLKRLAEKFNEMAANVEGHLRERERDLLLEKTIASQEDERQRVARELHDEVGQSLAALLMSVRNPEPQGSSWRNAIENGLTALMDRVHRLAWNLRPSILSDHGLDAALRRHLTETATQAGITIDYQGAGDKQASARLPESVELVVYRVAQEAVNNAVRHGHAQRISVVLLLGKEHVTLLIEDTGIGFDVAAMRREGGKRSLGLLGMEERVTLAGGELSIESSPGHGCSVRAKIPVERKA